jgi:uncharacterized membrane protein YeaQ/YmgE (transglycosylase-associated protein family)
MSLITNVVGWVLFGIVVGAIARWIYPGRQSMSPLATMGLGIAGSLLGGAAAYLLRLGMFPYSATGYIFSTLGAIALLAMGFFAQRRPASNSSATRF